MRQLIPSAPEFIASEDGHDKPDGEINAAKRLIARRGASGTALPYLIVGDGLYSQQPFILMLMPEPQPLHFILVATPTDRTDRFADVDGLRRGKPLERTESRDPQGRRHRCEWVTGVPPNAEPNSPEANFLEYTIFAADGSMTYHTSWVTDLTLDAQNVEWITRGGRARWKIENESFNTCSGPTSWRSSSIRASSASMGCTSGPGLGSVRVGNTGTPSATRFGCFTSRTGTKCFSGSPLLHFPPSLNPVLRGSAPRES